jgi:hypothetical protein
MAMIAPRTATAARALIVAAAGLATLAVHGARGQEEPRCRAAERFLVERVGMTAIVEADTIDDWRTRKLLPGCRVTAAGVTSRSLGDEAALFYDRLRDAGWTRTPDPRDAPNESSLRFRLAGTDCLFNIYSGTTLATDAEIRVNNAIVPARGQQRYNVLVLCVPAMDAAPGSD